jgi:hypothetical protein
MELGRKRAASDEGRETEGATLSVPEGQGPLQLGLGRLVLLEVLAGRLARRILPVVHVLRAAELVVGLEASSNDRDERQPESSSPERVDGFPCERGGGEKGVSGGIRGSGTDERLTRRPG